MFKQRKFGEDDNNVSDSVSGLDKEIKQKAKALSEDVDAFLDSVQEEEEYHKASVCCGCACN